MASPPTDAAPRNIVAAIWGLGKAGSALAASLYDTEASLPVVGNRNAERRTRFLSHHRPSVAMYARLPAFLRALRRSHVNVLFLAVPDDVLAPLARRLAKEDWLPPAVVHLSGSRGAEAIAALEPRAHIAAFHPLAALDAKRGIPPGALLAIDARDPMLRRRLQRLAKAMQLEPASVRPGQHARYHAGAVVSANLAVALLQSGIDLLVGAGIPEDIARRGLAHLLGSTARAAQEHSLAKMLTGPVARGDVGTVRRHLEVLAGDDTFELYTRLSLKLLAVANLPRSRRDELQRLLLDSRGDRGRV